MASKRNVIKATKSPMGSATCYTTNMTRCVIRPTYKGGATYLPGLQGERRLWMRWRVIETHSEEEVTHTNTVEPQSEIMDFHPSEVSGCCAAGVTPHASRGGSRRHSRIVPFQASLKGCFPKICASQVENVYCVVLYEVTAIQWEEEIFNIALLTVSLREETQISWDTSLYTFNYPAQQGFFILLCAQWSHFDKDYNWIKRRLYRISCQRFFFPSLRIPTCVFSKGTLIVVLTLWSLVGVCIHNIVYTYGWWILMIRLIALQHTGQAHRFERKNESVYYSYWYLEFKSTVKKKQQKTQTKEQY